MQRKRRSGRIAKEIAIVLLGTDTTGKMLSEETKTVVLSRHGAGVVSRYRFSPDELLTLRLPDSAKEAEIRLVGQIGGEARQNIEQHEIEEDVYSVNGNILRYCENCGTSTQWKKAEGEATPAAAPSMTSSELPASSLAASAEPTHSKFLHPSPASPPKPNFSSPPLSPAAST